MKIKGIAPEKFLKEFLVDPTTTERIAKPRDAAHPVNFLAPDEAEFITGSMPKMSGGREMH